MPIDPSTFRSVLGRFASGVTVATVRAPDGTDHGMTVSAFCSLSLQPPLVLMCIAHDAAMHAVLDGASHFAINILAAGQEAVARRFAEHLDDRFDGIGYERGATGAAILRGVLAFLECRLTERHTAGDHTIVIGEVIAAEASADRPLLYYRGGYAQLER